MTEAAYTYHANGKLLLSGEYFVLQGAKALALPLKVGQQLSVYPGLSSTKTIFWEAYYGNEVWFQCELNVNDFSVIKSNNVEKAHTLSKIFKSIKVLNPNFHPEAGTKLETILDAHPEWGFGSSSTLISLLSQWAGVDPFNLNQMIFNGSGFDIACAMSDGPILYTRDKTNQRIELDYPFEEQLLLIYSGKKKKTNTAVQSFLKEGNVSSYLIDEVSFMADEFARCSDQNTFNQLTNHHEKIVGSLINQTPVKKELFAEFQGEVKSLGAWGGDFWLVSGTQSLDEIKKYFENKGFSIIFKWAELILKPQI